MIAALGNALLLALVLGAFGVATFRVLDALMDRWP